MAVPTWAVGQVLAASDVNTWFVPRVAYKTSSETRTSTTTLAADSVLTLPVDANALYRAEVYLVYSGAATGTGDLKVQWNLPAGTVFNFQQLGYNPANSDSESFAAQSTAQPFTCGTSGTGSIRNVSFHGSLLVSSTAGNFPLTWAQNTSSATATTIFGGSYVALWRIG